MGTISRRQRTLTAAAVLREAGATDFRERSRLAEAMWEGWREVMRIKLGACIYGEWHERKRREAK